MFIQFLELLSTDESYYQSRRFYQPARPLLTIYRKRQILNYQMHADNLSKCVWMWETNAVNTVAPVAFRHLGLIVTWLIVTDYAQWKKLDCGKPVIHRRVEMQRLRIIWQRAMASINITLICARISGWVNDREAGDLRRHRAHFVVTVMRAKIVRLYWAHC